MSIFRNPSVDHNHPFPVPPSAPLEFHKKLPGYAPTPLVDLERLARNLGLQKLWVKDESDRLGLPAFKILGASWAIYRAIYRALLERLGEGEKKFPGLEAFRARLNVHSLKLTSATDGNHGRAVARMAKTLGVRSSIYVPEGTSTARIDAIRSEGAELTVVDGSYDDAVAEAAREAEHDGLLIQDTGWDGYEAIPRWIVEGYSTIFWEIDEALRKRNEAGPTVAFVQIGVGSLAESVVRHYRRESLETRPIIVGVEPVRAACGLESAKAGRIVRVPGPHDSLMAGCNCGTLSSVSWEAIQKGIEYFTAIDDDRVREAMRTLADEGITTGETGAGGLGGVLEILAQKEISSQLGLDRSARVLIISTEWATDPLSYEQITGRPPKKNVQ